MSGKKTDVPSWRDAAAKDVEQDVKRVAARLRDLAGAVERQYTQWADMSYDRVAAAVQHEVLWGVANLHLDQLTKTAAEADKARLSESE